MMYCFEHTRYFIYICYVCNMPTIFKCILQIWFVEKGASNKLEVQLFHFLYIFVILCNNHVFTWQQKCALPEKSAVH